MTKPTIASLRAQLAELDAKYAAAVQAVVEAQYAHGEALMEIERLKALIPAPRPTRPAYVRPAPAPEWLMRRAALDAAREQAMREGRSVKAAL